MLEKLKNLFVSTKNRTDGYANYKTGLGTDYSRTGNTHFLASRTIPEKTLTSLYRDNGIARRIVNILVEDSVRNYIEAESELTEELARLKAQSKLLEAGSFGRLYGGAIIVAFIDDGLELDQPINFNSVQRLVSLKVFDRHQIRWQPQDISQDLHSEYFGEPEYYTITKAEKFIADAQVSFRVHRSRCFSFGGANLPNRARSLNEGWDDSVLQVCYDALKKYDIVTSATAEIIQDFVQIIFKVKDLSMKLATEGGWNEVQKRLDIFNQTRSVAGAGFIDADSEDYEKRSSSVSGIDALWDRYSEFVCSVTGLPATKLFGKSPGGLNSTGESDLQMHYDNVRAYRADQIEPALKWLISILEVQKKWLNKPKSFDWEFPSLTSPSESEWADIKKKYAEIDAIYMDRGAIDPVESWQERFGQGAFNTNIALSRPTLEPLPNEIDSELDDMINNRSNMKIEEQKMDKIIDAMFDRASLKCKG